MQTSPFRLPPIETKFFCRGSEQRLGSAVDGWIVVWCQPDRQHNLWHSIVLRHVGANRHDLTFLDIDGQKRGFVKTSPSDS